MARFNSDITGDKAALKTLRQLGKYGEQAMTRATNNAGRRARTLSSKEIRAQVNLKAGYVRNRLKIKRATRSRPEFVISAAKRGVLMTRYPYRTTRRGVTVKIKRTGARAVLEGAFVTQVNAGGRKVDVVAVRQPGRFSTGNRRFKVLYSPSVSQVFNKVRGEIKPEVDRYFEEQIRKELNQALRRFQQMGRR